MKSFNSVTWIATAALAAGLAAGCDQNPESAASSMGRIDQKVDQATADMKQQSAGMGNPAADTTITTKVKTAIVSEPGLRAAQINVDTADGVVTLTGSVDSPQKAERATQVAQAVTGVKSVDNRLDVKSSG